MMLDVYIYMAHEDLTKMNKTVGNGKLQHFQHEIGGHLGMISLTNHHLLLGHGWDCYNLPRSDASKIFQMPQRQWNNLREGQLRE